MIIRSGPLSDHWRSRVLLLAMLGPMAMTVWLLGTAVASPEALAARLSAAYPLLAMVPGLIAFGALASPNMAQGPARAATALALCVLACLAPLTVFLMALGWSVLLLVALAFAGAAALGLLAAWMPAHRAFLGFCAAAWQLGCGLGFSAPWL